jgi:hypothetical protein
MYHLLSSFVSAVSQLWKATAYHPERHYMRGPGPKWREKHSRMYRVPGWRRITLGTDGTL